MTEKELRELDAWIAETIFGWHKVKTGDNKSLCSVCGNGFGARHQHYVPEFHSSMSGSVPRYTTDPASAMQVLEKCADKLDGFEVVIGFHRYRADEPAKFMVCSSNHRGFQSVAETLPLAVCLFAKRLFSK